MSRKLDEKIELRIGNALASTTMDIPGEVIIPEEEMELYRKFAYGEITVEEFLEIVKNDVGAVAGKTENMEKLMQKKDTISR